MEMWLFDGSQGMWVGSKNKLGLTLPLVCVVMNSYLGLEGCSADILSVCVALNCVPRASSARYSQPFLSLTLILLFSQPQSPIIPVRQVFPL